MNIQEPFREIPFEELEKMGLNKEVILDLSKENINLLMTGRRTGLIELNIHNQKIKAKISLYKNQNNKTVVLVHPIRKEIDNKYNLSKDEIRKLQNGMIVHKKIDDNKYIFQLDKETNEILKADTSKIIIPSHLNDYHLSNKNKSLLKEGKTISFVQDNKKITATIDLNISQNINAKDLIKKQNIGIKGTILEQ